MVDLKNSEMLSNWDKWKSTLANAVSIGQVMGMSDETISRIGAKVGTFLSAAVDPENPQERVLQELWRVADDEDRKTLVKLIVKMVQTEVKH